MINDINGAIAKVITVLLLGVVQGIGVGIGMYWAVKWLNG